jgi:hypothetical protein
LLQKNKDIIISKADKGNVVVVQDKKEYIEKVKTLLATPDYECLPQDPTKKIKNKVVNAVKHTRAFDDKTRRYITPQFSKPPHMYALVKIHKAGYSIHPIVSGIGSPTEKLARYLLPSLNPLVGQTDTYVKNSQDFINKIKDRVIPNGTLIGSLDVTNLFTTTPVDKTLEILKSRLEEDTSLKDRTHLSIYNIMDLVRVCVYNTYFQFEDKFYRQTRGMAMGSPFSPVICNIFMENFERRAIDNSSKEG